jgi:hypothetical protein
MARSSEVHFFRHFCPLILKGSYQRFCGRKKSRILGGKCLIWKLISGTCFIRCVSPTASPSMVRHAMKRSRSELSVPMRASSPSEITNSSLQTKSDGIRLRPLRHPVQFRPIDDRTFFGFGGQLQPSVCFNQVDANLKATMQCRRYIPTGLAVTVGCGLEGPPNAFGWARLNTYFLDHNNIMW